MVVHCEADLEVIIGDSFRQYPAIRSELESELVSQVARLFMAAQRSVLIAGRDVAAYSRKWVNQIVSEADLALFVGSHIGGQVTHCWQAPGHGTAIVQIDKDSSTIGRNYPAHVAMLEIA